MLLPCPRVAIGSITNFRQFDPAVWLAISYIYILAWEPSVAQGTHSFSRRVPAYGRKLRF